MATSGGSGRKGSALVPAGALAASSGSTAIAERPSATQAIDKFVAALGGRDRLVETLEVAAGAPEVDKILALMVDPRYADWSLQRLCGLAGLTVADFFAAFRTSALVKAQIEAIAVIAGGIVPVVADVMKRAAPHEEVCDACQGLGEITPNPSKRNPNPTPEPCKGCHGTGRRIYTPDLDRQQLALELAELLKKGGGGISLTQQVVTLPTAAGTGSGDLERLQQILAGAAAAPLILDVEPGVEPGVAGDDGSSDVRESSDPSESLRVSEETATGPILDAARSAATDSASGASEGAEGIDGF